MRPGSHLSIACWYLILALAPSIGEAGGDAVRFAPLPLEDRKIIHEQFRGLVDYLQTQTGLSLQWTQYTDYAEILAAFRAGRVDLAYLGPLPYVILARDYPPAEPLACFRDTDGAAEYTCSLIVAGESAITLDGVVGRAIALTQPYSTCGYLAVSEMLRVAGRRLDGDGNRFEYAGSHSAAALGVAQGRYEVAGVKTSIAERYAHLDLVPIAESHSWPGFALVANRETLSESVRTRLRTALEGLDPETNPGLAATTRGWGKQIRNGTLAPARCDYSRVAEALESLPWPIPGSESAR